MKYRVNKQKIKLLFAVFFIFIFCLILFFFITPLFKDPSVPPAEDSGNPLVAVINDQSQKYLENTDLEKWLIIGTDKSQDASVSFGGTNNSQNDFNLLLILDSQANTYQAMLINRDTMVKMNQLDISGSVYGSTVAQLALAHSYGDGSLDSCKNVSDAVSGLLYGIHIDHYVFLTMEVVPLINDAVDGVTVKLEEDLSSLSPSWTCGSTVTLRGDDSLLFVRARQSLSDGTNLSRMNRQSQYLLSLRDRLADRSKSDPEFSFSLISDIFSYLTVDTVVTRLCSFADTLTDSEFIGLLSIEGEARYNEATDHTEFYPNEELLKELVIKTFFLPSK